MKQQFKATLLFVLTSVIMFAFIPPKHRLPGKWTIYNADGTSIGEYVELKSDGTYNVYMPGEQIGETGYYKMKHHVFSIRNAKDYVCGKGYWGNISWNFMEMIPFILRSLKIPVLIEDMISLASIRA